MCDFSLLDAIKCGIGKLPRVPVADNITGADAPKFHNLWDHIGKRMPKKGVRKPRGRSRKPCKTTFQADEELDLQNSQYRQQLYSAHQRSSVADDDCAWSPEPRRSKWMEHHRPRARWSAVEI
jgi:hypothetical protein